MTGKYLRDYEGMLDATLSKEEETYILTVWQDDQALTIFLSSWNWKFIFYEYGEVAHFWVPGYEYLRLLEYQIAICPNMITLEKIARILKKKSVGGFSAFKCYPAVPEKYLAEESMGGGQQRRQLM